MTIASEARRSSEVPLAVEVSTASRPRNTDSRATRRTAAVLIPVSLVLVGLRLAGIDFSHTIHGAAFAAVALFVVAYPVLRLTRRIAGCWIALRPMRFAVWNATWTVCLLWVLLVPALMGAAG